MYEGHSNHKHAERDSRGQEGPGQQFEDGKGDNHRDERWWPACGGDVQVYRCSAPGQVGGGRSRCNRDKWSGAKR